MTRVDVVIPVYNEERALPQSIPELRAFLAGADFPYDWHIRIADNASIDDTPAVSRELEKQFPGEVEYVRIERKGRGFALKQVWGEGDADVLTYMDVDLSTGLEAYPALTKAVADDGYGVAIGSRLMKRSQVTRSLKRRILTTGYNAMIKGMFFTRFSDAQCGFKGIRLASVRPYLASVVNDNWFFDTELMLLLDYGGRSVESLPIEWIEDLDSRVQILSYVIENLEGLARMRRSLGSSLRRLET